MSKSAKTSHWQLYITLRYNDQTCAVWDWKMTLREWYIVQRHYIGIYQLMVNVVYIDFLFYFNTGSQLLPESGRDHSKITGEIFYILCSNYLSRLKGYTQNEHSVIYSLSKAVCAA